VKKSIHESIGKPSLKKMNDFFSTPPPPSFLPASHSEPLRVGRKSYYEAPPPLLFLSFRKAGRIKRDILFLMSPPPFFSSPSGWVRKKKIKTALSNLYRPLFPSRFPFFLFFFPLSGAHKAWRARTSNCLRTNAPPPLTLPPFLSFFFLLQIRSPPIVSSSFVRRAAGLTPPFLPELITPSFFFPSFSAARK